MYFEFAMSIAVYTMAAAFVYSFFLDCINAVQENPVDSHRKVEKQITSSLCWEVQLPTYIPAPYGEGYKSRLLLAQPVYCGYGKYGNAYRGDLWVLTQEGQLYSYGMWTWNGHILKCLKHSPNGLWGYEYVGRVRASVYDNIKENIVVYGYLTDENILN